MQNPPITGYLDAKKYPFRRDSRVPVVLCNCNAGWGAQGCAPRDQNLLLDRRKWKIKGAPIPTFEQQLLVSTDPIRIEPVPKALKLEIRIQDAKERKETKYSPTV